MSAGQPRMAVPVAISAIVHALVLGGFAVSARFSWPSLPIPIEIQPRRAVRDVGPEERRGQKNAPTETPKPKPKRAPGAGASPTPPAPPPRLPPPQTTDLKPFAPDDAHVMVLLRTDKLRRSPHRRGIEDLLAVFPDWAMLVEGTQLAPLDDFDALLIATADPHDVTATFLAARHHDLARVRAIADRPMRPGDPRVFRFPAPGLAVLAEPGDADRLAAGERTDGGTDDARARWVRELEKFDRVAREPNGPAVVVTVTDAPILFRFGDGLPTPQAIALAATAELAPALHARLVFATDGQAARFEAAWPDILRRWRSMTALLGLAPALDDLKPRRTGAEVELEGRVPEAQTRLGLAFARALFPQQQVPYRGAVDGGAPAR